MQDNKILQGPDISLNLELHSIPYPQNSGLQ